MKVFVSGCYDIIHGGHVEFWSQAKALGDYLVVSVASDDVLIRHKGRKSSVNIEHKKKIIQSISFVDEVVVSEGTEEGLDFKDHFLRIKPDILAVTDDDKYSEKKKKLCESIGAKYVILPKTLGFEQVSTTQIINFIKAPIQVPLRVDFAGGWLDVPANAVQEGYIANCTIQPVVSLNAWPYKIMGGGLGGSAAYAVLTGKDAVKSELDLGAGWQDPAVIMETGFCVWESGERPKLMVKVNPSFLNGKMALLWTGKNHYTPGLKDKPRDYVKIKEAGQIAFDSVRGATVDYLELCNSVDRSYDVQLDEGMDELPDIPCKAKKYCGGGWGGYALYMFYYNREKALKKYKELIPIEPYIRTY